MNTQKNNQDRARLAFTLIEMLTVITIMSIVAALVVTMGQAASQKKKITAVNGEKAKLTTMIGNYYAKLNYYPPDNGALATNTIVFSNYDAMAATNPLIYELAGGTNLTENNVPYLFVFNSSNSAALLPAPTYSNIFNRGGIANGDPSEPHDFFQPGPLPKEYNAYNSVGKQSPHAHSQAPLVCGLVVPADLYPNQTNFWHYDSSSTNRHNMDSYDLWAEFSIGSKNGQLTIITNGNW
jgi:prepilin-type N-terminal cleavage/methylation domain-containing protein